MRFWIAINLLTTLTLVVSTGCQSLNTGGGKSSLFGKRPGLGINRANEIDPDELLDPLGARNTNRLVLDDLGPGQIATTLATRTIFKNNPEKANEAFQLGQDYYEQGLAEMEANPDGDSKQVFDKAANQFRIAAANMPDSALEQDALFFEGESYFFADRYVQANRAFEKLIARYSGTRYLDQAEARRFAIAQYWHELIRNHDGWLPNIALADPSRPKLNMKGEARRILHRIRVDDPTGKLSDDATMALANAYFEDKRYFDAADTYEDLRINYPGSKHVFHAMLFEIKSRMQSYQGESYDEEPLLKADNVLQMLVNQFPDKAREEEEYLKNEAGMIRHMLAQRDYSMGQYYERRGENRAAQIVYQRVRENFNDTGFGEEVETRLAGLEDNHD